MGLADRTIQETRRIRAFRRRVVGILFFKYLLILSALWGFLWGLAVLVLRVVGGIDHTALLWGFCGLIPAGIVAVVLAVGRVPSARSVRALLDKQSVCGGLLMAGEDAPLGEWRAHLPRIVRPRYDGEATGRWGYFYAHRPLWWSVFLSRSNI